MTPATATIRHEPIPPAPLIGRDELNLAEFPIALIAERASKDLKTIYFEDKHGRLTVTGSDKDGLPTAVDADVLLALIYLTKQRNNFRDARVNFSRYQLIKLLNWHDIGQYYQRLDLSLNRWHGVSLQYDGCWWNNRLKRYTDRKLHIIEDVEIIGNEARQAGQTELPLSWFEWNKTFIESCQADNLRQINLDEYFSLKSAISKRLYRFLGKRFYLQGDWTFDLREIAFERVGLSRSYADAGKIKEKLQPAIDELEAIGFLKPLDRDKRYNRIDRGQWTIRLIRKSPALVATSAAQPEPPTSPLVAELIKRGVTASTAAELAERHPAETIQAKIHVFDWMMEKQDKRLSKSPAGYLCASISKDYSTPKGYVSPAERQARKEAEAAKEREKAEARRREREEEDRERAEKQAINDYWQSLTPEQQAEVDAAANTQADPEQLALEIGALKSFGQRLRRHQYIRQLLLDRQNQPVEA